MKKHELDKLRQMMGDTATALDASYVRERLDELGISVDEAAALPEKRLLAIVTEGLDAGAYEIRSEMERAWGSVPDEVDREFADGTLLMAINAWLHGLDHQVSGGTSETCLASYIGEAVDDIERRAERVLSTSDAWRDIIRWWGAAYRVLAALRERPDVNYLSVCEHLLNGNIEAAADEVGVEIDW